jgi:integrase
MFILVLDGKHKYCICIHVITVKRMSKSPFLNDVAQRMKTLRYAKRTIETYVFWINAYILFSGRRHPDQMGEPEVESFLSYLANQRNVSQATQRLALNALVFLYDKIIGRPLKLNLQFNRSTIAKKLPVVLTQQEIKQLLNALPSHFLLPAQLLYGSGLRLMEVLRLRIGDVDFDYGCLRIWQAKGGTCSSAELQI